MKLIVNYYPPNGEAETHEFPGYYEPKLYTGGVLKIEEPGEIDVPEIGKDKDKKMAVTPSTTHAVFNGNYSVTYEG